MDSPLTEGALEVICKLPNLRELSVFIKGNTLLPTLVLPNLTGLSIKHAHNGDWLKGFRGATLGKVETITFLSGSEQIGDFLERFERVALATSIQNTLSGFFIYTSCAWNPNYSSLLSFTQLATLVINSSCDNGCSSTVDDDIITILARAMPRLECLELGYPCGERSTGITVKGLAILAHHCLDLSSLSVHFQVDSLSDPPVVDVVPSTAGSATLRRSCALRGLDSGEMSLATELVPTVALTLVFIFPHIERIYFANDGWEKVMKAIRHSRRIVNYSSKKHSLHTSN